MERMYGLPSYTLSVSHESYSKVVGRREGRYLLVVHGKLAVLIQDQLLVLLLGKLDQRHAVNSVSHDGRC